MSKYITFLLSILCLTAYGQDKTAQKILDKLSDTYDGYKSITLDITMIIDYPEKGKEEQVIQIIQEGDRFVYKAPDQTMYCDGNVIWLYIQSRNEVQINDFELEDDDGILTPKDLLDQYKTGKYEYALTDKSKGIATIEFKPLDDFNDYAKFKLSIHQKSNELKSILAIGKDGSRVTLDINNIKADIDYGPEYFVFDASKYKDVIIEDLRIN